LGAAGKGRPQPVNTVSRFSGLAAGGRGGALSRTDQGQGGASIEFIKPGFQPV